MCDVVASREELLLVRKADPAKNKAEQFRCKPCNALKSRIHRITSKDISLNGYNLIQGEDRKELYKKAQGLFDEKLSKVISESVLASTIKRKTDMMITGGKYAALSQIKEDLENVNPTKLNNILANAERMMCPVTREELILVPEYEVRFKDEHIDQTTESRKIEGEQDVKRAKVIKAKLEQFGGEEEKKKKQEKDVPLTEAQAKRIQKHVEKFEELKLAATSILIMAEAPEHGDFAPKAIIEKLRASIAGVDAWSEEAGKIMKARAATKSALKDLFAACKDKAAAVESNKFALRTCIDAAQ